MQPLLKQLYSLLIRLTSSKPVSGQPPDWRPTVAVQRIFFLLCIHILPVHQGSDVRFPQCNCSNRRHPHAGNVYSFLSEVLNAQPTTSTVLAFDPDHRAAPAGPDPWWRSDDSLRAGRTVHCIDCGNPDPDHAAHFELRRGYLP